MHKSQKNSKLEVKKKINHESSYETVKSESWKGKITVNKILEIYHIYNNHIREFVMS